MKIAEASDGHTGSGVGEKVEKGGLRPGEEGGAEAEKVGKEEEGEGPKLTTSASGQ